MKNYLYLFYFILIFPNSIFSNPKNPDVIAGKASFSNIESKTLLVNASNKTIINWESFNIEKNEITKIVLPSAQGVILNRVVGKNLSSLAGRLESNGFVYLVNPSGIMITKDGVINTAGFLASTLEIKDGDFLEKENLTFLMDEKSSIVNVGKIECVDGDVVLMGCVVKNEGEINCKKGRCALGSGKEILLTPCGQSLLTIKVPLEDDVTHIDQKGKIEAIQVELKTEVNPYHYAMAIKQDGIIEAQGYAKKDGKIFLIAKGGVVETKGDFVATNEDKGGEIQILGRSLHLVEGKIDASGQTGGGVVLIGGDCKGKNPEIYNAEVTFVEKGAKIYADAIEKGDGGKIIFWGNKVNSFEGEAYARGGKFSGNGGFTEISSKGNFFHNGLVDLTAEKGKVGSLLLDPSTITISGAASVNILWTGGDPNTAYSTSTTATLTASTMLTNLQTANIIVDATVGGALGTGDITLATSLTLGAAHGSNYLNFKAYRTLTCGPPITVGAGYTGNLIFETDPGGGGNISMAGGITFSTASSNNISFTTPGNISITGTALALNTTGTLTMTAGGSIQISAGVRNSNLSAGNWTITAGSNFIVGTGALVSAVAFGSRAGTMTFNIGNNLDLLGSTNANAYAQIGYDSTSATSNITFNNIGGRLLLQCGSGSQSYAAIGHGNGLDGQAFTTRSGNITFTSIGGNVIMEGYNGIVGPPTRSFVQIGHLRSMVTGGTISGNIQLSSVTGIIGVYGGAYQDCYALIGHGGRTATTADVISGDVGVTASGPNSRIDIASGTGDKCFAAIGHTAYAGSGSITMNVGTNSVVVSATNNIQMQDNANTNASIGYRIFTTSGTPTIQSGGTVSIVSTNGNLIVSDLHNSPTAFSSTVIGACASNENYPPTFFGDAGCDIDINVAGGISLTSGSRIGNSNTFGYIINGHGSGTGTITIAANSTAGIALLGGSGDAGIVCVGDLDLQTGGTLELYGDGGGDNTRKSFIQVAGASNIGIVSYDCWGQGTGEAISYFSGAGTTTMEIDSFFMLGDNAHITETGGDLILQGPLGADILAFELYDYATMTNSSGGSLEIRATNINLTGSDGYSPGNATITANPVSPKTLSIYASGRLLFSQFATVSIASGSGNLIIDSVGELTMGTSSSIVNSGTGLTNVAAGNILMNGRDATHMAEISAASNNVTINPKNFLNMVENAQVKLNGGSGKLLIDIQNAGVFGDLAIQKTSSIQNAGSGQTEIDANAIYMLGKADIQSVGLITANLSADLNMNSSTNGDAYISGQNGINIMLNNLFMQGESNKSYISNVASNIVIEALNDIAIYDNAYISNSGGGMIYLVVDQNAPTAPNIGSGSFYLTFNGSINSVGMVKIFSASPSQNIVLGKINSETANSSIAEYDIWYDTYIAGGDPAYMFFYKTSSSTPIIPSAYLLAYIAAQGPLMFDDFYDYLSPKVLYFDLTATIEEIFDKKDFYYKMLPYEVYSFFKKRYSGIKLHSYMNKQLQSQKIILELEKEANELKEIKNKRMRAHEEMARELHSLQKIKSKREKIYIEHEKEAKDMELKMLEEARAKKQAMINEHKGKLKRIDETKASKKEMLEKYQQELKEIDELKAKEEEMLKKYQKEITILNDTKRKEDVKKSANESKKEDVLKVNQKEIPIVNDTKRKEALKKPSNENKKEEVLKKNQKKKI